MSPATSRREQPSGQDHRVVSMAGHVDHGKSTLLRTLTGMAPDRLAEERRRGLTIDLGFVWTTLPPTPTTRTPQTVAFVDVPGHERFVPTMLAGTGSAPATLFVVAADDGWSAQSSEHRDALDLLGVPAIARVVTKADTVPAETIERVVAGFEEATAGTTLAASPMVVTDALTGRGIDRLRTVLRDRLAALPVPEDGGRPRLWLDRSFHVDGVGAVVTGTLTEGSLAVGDTATVLPAGRNVRIRRLQALGDDVERAGPGTRVAANLAGVGHDELVRGDALVVGGPWRATAVADLWVRALPGEDVDRRGAWRLHVGTASVSCQLRPVAGPVPGGREGAVRVVFDRPLPLVAGDRVVLRETGRRATVAGGVIVDPAPVDQLRGRQARARHASAIADLATGHDRSTASTAPVPVDRERRARWLRGLVGLAGGTRDSLEARAAAGWPDGAVLPAELIGVGSHLVDTQVLARWESAVRELGEGTHDRADVAARARAVGAPADAATGLADHLVDTGALVRTTHGVALPEHVASSTDARRARAAALVAALAAEPFCPPDVDELSRAHGLDHRERAALVVSGAIVRCGEVTFARSAIEQAADVLRVLESRTGPFTASQAREALGTTRRYAIPLLEHLQRTGVTVFDGQVHRLRT
jgi:selenocysteine-specific elongation factor